MQSQPINQREDKATQPYLTSYECYTAEEHALFTSVPLQHVNKTHLNQRT